VHDKLFALVSSQSVGSDSLLFVSVDPFRVNPRKKNFKRYFGKSKNYDLRILLSLLIISSL